MTLHIRHRQVALKPELRVLHTMLATADHALAAVAMDVDGDASAAAPARPHCPPWAASCGDRALALLVTAAVVSAWRGAWLVCDACFLTRAPFQSAIVGLALGGALFTASNDGTAKQKPRQGLKRTTGQR